MAAVQLLSLQKNDLLSWPQPKQIFFKNQSLQTKQYNSNMHIVDLFESIENIFLPIIGLIMSISGMCLFTSLFDSNQTI